MEASLKNDVKRSMKYIVDDLHMLSGLAVAYGNLNFSDSIYYGNAQEVTYHDGRPYESIIPLNQNSIYDLASLTKLFTCLSIMLLAEKGKLKLNETVYYYDKRFINLKNTSIEDTMCYKAVLETSERIDCQESREDALSILFNIKNTGILRKRLYSDMNAMVLKYVIEAVSNTDFATFIKENILVPCDMNNTYSIIPTIKKNLCLDYNYEYRLIKGKTIVFDNNKIATVHDPKARVISADGKDLCGHAGLFSTIDDMKKLCTAIVRFEILKKETLLKIGVNRVGFLNDDGEYRQYLGLLCFSKSAVQYLSEVPEWMTKNAAFGLSGYTGNHIAIDPVKGVFDVFLGNKCHNRVTTIVPRADSIKYNLNKNGSGVISINGNKVFSSFNYVHLKDKYLHNIIRDIIL